MWIRVGLFLVTCTWLQQLIDKLKTEKLRRGLLKVQCQRLPRLSPGMRSDLFPSVIAVYLVCLKVYVLKRPHVDEFLQKMGELFECVLFTASLAKVRLSKVSSHCI